MTFVLFKQSGRGGTFICERCSQDYYIGPKAIVNRPSSLCDECMHKHNKIKAKQRLWKQLSKKEQERAIHLHESGSDISIICELLNIHRLSLVNSLYKAKRLPSKNVKTVHSILYSRITTFIKLNVNRFSVDELLTKIGPNPKCYITGQPIDLMNTESYQLDHIIPVSKGGPPTLDNCGLCLANVNKAKGNMSLEEFCNMCK